jgi:small-conductance mechanosensitive channel
MHLLDKLISHIIKEVFSFTKFTLSIIIGIVALIIVLIFFLVWLSVDRSIVERRAKAFCDAFTVGTITSRENVQKLLMDTPYRVLLVKEYAILATFPTILPEYYSCTVQLDNWKVIDKNLQFKD